MFLPVTLPHRKIYFNAYAFLDTESTNSYKSQPTPAYLQLEETNHQEQLLIESSFNSKTLRQWILQFIYLEITHKHLN